MPWTLAALLFCAVFNAAHGLKISVRPGQTECLTENILSEHFTIPGPRIDGRVLVSGTSQYYTPFVTVKVIGPHDAQLWERTHVYDEAHFNVPARGPGRYQTCFSNPHDSHAAAMVDLVYFSLAHLRSGGNLLIPKGTEGDRSTEVAHKDDMDAAKRAIMSMTEFVEVVGGSQRFLSRKLERHKRTMESNGRRAAGYALLEVFVLVLVMAIQVFTVTKLFERSTRVRGFSVCV